MFRSLAQYPLVTAALVAAFGVALIVFSSVWPESSPDAISDRAEHERLVRSRVVALDELKAAGASGNVDVVDFGDGVGLGFASAARGVEPGAVLLRVPEALALDVRKTRSCGELAAAVASTAASSSSASSASSASSGSAPRFGEAATDCRIERFVVSAVESGEATRLTGLLTLLVMERRRGTMYELPPTVASAVLAVLPDPQWQNEHGIFAIDADEFRIMSLGTSMEGWRDAALNSTAEALAFIQSAGGGSLEEDLGGEVGLHEVRWAYLVLHAYGQWTEGSEEPGAAGAPGVAEDDGIGLPPEVLFLWPLFLARSTAETQHGVNIRRAASGDGYEVITPKTLWPGDEVLFVDRRLSDASALCYRGLWLTSRHRARLDLYIPSTLERDPKSEPLLQRVRCSGQPLRLYVEARKLVDPHFLSCMRALALSSNSTKLELALTKVGWEKAWPDTRPVGRRTEARAAELAIDALQQALNRIGASGEEIRQRFGSDSVGSRPTVRVREAETMVIIGLLKSMKEYRMELQLMSSNDYLYEALRDAQEVGIMHDLDLSLMPQMQ